MRFQVPFEIERQLVLGECAVEHNSQGANFDVCGERPAL